MPKAARKIVEQELDDWAKLGVDAHLDAGTPWYSYHETLREPTARLVGAKPNEVICMNSLTVNLHLMMATFYRPTKSRNKILPTRTRSKRRSFIMGSIRRRRSSWRGRAKESSLFARMTSRLRWRGMAISSRWYSSVA
jgi:kynureninase